MTYITFVSESGTSYRSDIDLGLIVESVVISEASVKTRLLDVPGRNGLLDCSEALGVVALNTRTMTINAGKTLINRWTQAATLQKAIHGKRMKITVSSDPDYYWEGRVSVGTFSPEFGVGHVVIIADVAPYKLKSTETIVSTTLTGSYKTIALVNECKPVVPEVTVNAASTLQFGDTTLQVAAGTHKLPDISLEAGSNALKAKVTGASSGTITVKYREGSL